MKTPETNAVIAKITIAIFLIGCLFKMPYGYYQLMRVAVCFLFGWLSYMEYKIGMLITAILCGLCVVLFNPIIKLFIHKQQWQIIDRWLAVFLIIWLATDTFRILKKRRPKIPVGTK